MTAVTRFDDLLGQAPAIELLRRILASGCIPSSLLFAGPRGVGRGLAARALATSANCERGSGCGACAACREADFGEGLRAINIAALFEDEGEKNRVRALRAELASHSNAHRLPYLVVVIENAALMNDAMQASMLKSIEEPPAGVRYIFIVESPAQLLPTIRSRSMTVRFRPLESEMIVRILEREGRVSPSSASKKRTRGDVEASEDDIEGASTDKASVSSATLSAIAALSDGSLARARELLAAGAAPHELVRKDLLSPSVSRVVRRDLLARLSLSIPIAGRLHPAWLPALLELDGAIAANGHIGLAYAVFRNRIAELPSSTRGTEA